MDFSLIEKCELEGNCYKLLRANFYRNYYVIIVQNKKEFCCGSICANLDEAICFFEKIAQSNTDVYCLSDILNDFAKQKT